MRKIPYRRAVLGALAEREEPTLAILREMLRMIFTSKSASYRALRRSLPGFDSYDPHERPRMPRGLSENAIRVTLSRLKKEGLVESRTRGSWALTATGRAAVYRNRTMASSAQSGEEGNARILIAFDIPEYDRSHRRWIRQVLREEGFIPFQKSVWMGARPLPEEFFRELVRRDLQERVSILRIGSPGTARDNFEKLRRS